MKIKNKFTAKGLGTFMLGCAVLISSCTKDESVEPVPDPVQLDELKMATGTTSGAFLFQRTFEETGALNNLYLEKANSNSITVSSEQSKDGKYAAKFVLNKTDADQGGSKRAEITPLSPEKDPKAERWYGMSIFLPSSYVTDKSGEILFQWHANGNTSLDGYSMSNPPIAMTTSNGNWKLNLKTQATMNTVDLGPYDKNVWTDWVFHIKFSWQSDGVLEIWKNGKLVLSRKAPNTYNYNQGNFFKFGIYKWDWKEGNPSSTTQRVVYFDEVRIGNESSSYADVAPRSNGSATAPAPTSPAPGSSSSNVSGSGASTGTGTSTSQGTVVFAVNAGGGSYKAANGITYQADKYYNGGSTFKTNASISNTDADIIYQTERFGNFTYSIPVTPGNYQVRLKFSENYWKASGKRLFDVYAEGSKIVSDLDIFHQAGSNKAYEILKSVTVKDNTLNLSFRTDKDYAKVSAIDIIKK